VEFNLNKEEGMRMGKRFVFKTFIYFLCISFLLLTNGFHTMVTEAKGIDRPIGEMISRGEVKFESRENVWKDVEPSHFPIFQGVKIRTEKGASIITLENNSQVEVGQNSLLSFDRNDQVCLVQGSIEFRFLSTAELSFKVGNLTVMKYKSLQASQNPSAVSQNSEETMGSISMHPNGSVTVRSTRGSLSIVNQEHVVLAALSSKDTVTIPSVTAKSPSKVMVAKTGGTEPGGSSEGEFLGLSTGQWFWIGFGVAALTAVVVGIAIYESNKGHHHHYYLPVCP
jgi:hypothetical protein